MSHYRLPEEAREDIHPECYPQGSKVIMSCGNGSGLAIPTDSRGGKGKSQSSLVAGTVSLNTRELRCATVKIDFSSMINYQVKSWDGEYLIRIIFQLSKACDGGQKVPLGTWVYEKEVDKERYSRNGIGPAAAVNGGCPPPQPEVEMVIKEPFGFTWCGCTACPDCCLYLVEVIDVDSDNIKCLSLTNVSISAMAMNPCPK